MKISSADILSTHLKPPCSSLRKAKPPCDIPIRGLMERASKRYACKRSRSTRSFWLLCSRLHSSFGRSKGAGQSEIWMLDACRARRRAQGTPLSSRSFGVAYESVTLLFPFSIVPNLVPTPFIRDMSGKAILVAWTSRERSSLLCLPE